MRLLGEKESEDWLLRALGVMEGEEATGGSTERGEVAADWWTDEHRAMEEEESDEQWRGVTQVEQLQQQLHWKVQ